MRTVTLPMVAATALADHLATSAEPGPDGLVFPAERRGPLRRSNFTRRVWMPATRAVGVEGLCFHDLRHTAATLAGSMTTGPDLQAGVRNLAYGLVPFLHRAPGITGTLNDVPGLAAHRDRRRPDDGRSSVSGLALDGASSQIGSTVASGGCDAVHDHAGRQPGSDLRKEAALCLPRGADAGASRTGTTRRCSRSLGFPGPPRPRSAIRDRLSGFVMGR